MDEIGEMNELKKPQEPWEDGGRSEDWKEMGHEERWQAATLIVQTKRGRHEMIAWLMRLVIARESRDKMAGSPGPTRRKPS